MFDKFKELVIGDIEGKREYKAMMKRVNALPKDYSYAFKKIQYYIYSVSGLNGTISVITNMNIFMDLIDLFETSVADKRSVSDVIGSDVSKFSDEFVSAYIDKSQTLGSKLNKEIMEKFNKEGR